MPKIVQGSDLHFGRFHDPSVAEAFRRHAREIAPELIVLSGDFTQRAKIREYEQVEDYLDRLPDVPTVVTPGNHDVPLYRVFERLFAPYRNYRRYVSEDLDTTTRVPGLTVVSLNSAAPRRAIVNGRITSEQLDYARRVFAEAPAEDCRAVVMHHHLAPAPDYEGDRPLPRAREILGAFNDMDVELALGGHLHRAYIGNSLDVAPSAGRERGIVIVQCGTTTSLRGRARERAKNSFNVIDVGAHHLEVTHYLHFHDGDRFAPVSVHTFPRRPARWLDTDHSRASVPEKERSTVPEEVA